ncbi:cell division protein FtsL [Saezia sanguinis]|uniref:cell division protein FtsL n=1 Tax=Saezia sanguinis TaxID=1965230 RepID=UPI003056AE8B
MTKLNVLLLLAVLASGLALVYSTHEGRLLYTALAGENTAQNELDLDYKRLQQERQSLVAPGRIEQNAHAVLQMVPATLGVTEFVPRDQRALAGYVPQLPLNVRIREEGAHHE